MLYLTFRGRAKVYLAGQEDILTHFAIFYKKHVEWDEAAEVDDISIVFHSHLPVVQRLHLHDWAQGVERQGDINALVWCQWCMDGQRNAGDDTKAILVKLNCRVCHVLQSFVGEVHFLIDVSLGVSKCS